MQNLWLYIIGFLIGASLIALAIVGYRLKTSGTRVNRSLAPILQNLKTLKIEVSALKRSRLDRQRRLEGKGSKERKPNK